MDPVDWPDGRPVAQAVLCAPCMAAGVLRRLEWDLLRNWYQCPKHGGQVTGEAIWRLDR